MTSASRLLMTSGALAAGAGAIAYAAYRKDIKAATQAIESDSQVIDSENGPIEFAEAGDGPAVLLVHGAGGGFDQGLDLGRAFVGEGFRLIAPSRFGYLGSPVLADGSAAAQADAHVRVLDALHVDAVPVIGVSAGAPSAMQLSLKHPDRCSALVLVVPLAYAPNRVDARAPSPFFAPLLNAVASFDFLFWTAMKIAHSTMLETILGTPVDDYRAATKDVRRAVDETLRNILPISKRAAGIANDTVVASSLTRYPLDDIAVPTLVISAADDLYGTYETSVYTAEQIRNAKLVAFATGGHLLVGHDAEVRSEIRAFLKKPDERRRGIALAG